MAGIRASTINGNHSSPTWLGLLVALVLLGHPLLCIAHCELTRPTPTAPDVVAFGFYCPLTPHHHQTNEPAPAPIPASWPGVLVSLVLLSGVLLLARLASPRSPALVALQWAPPVPPPR